MFNQDFFLISIPFAKKVKSLYLAMIDLCSITASSQKSDKTS